MRVQVVDPSAFTPPYDHALCTALARAGADVELVTSRFAYGAAPPADGYRRRELFYRHARGAPSSRARRAFKLAEHVPDMLRYRRLATAADVVHFQWLDVQWLDRFLLPAHPTVLTAHDLLPREARRGQARAQRRLYDAVDAIVVHSEYGRRQLEEVMAVDPSRVHVIHHGAFEHLVGGGGGGGALAMAVAPARTARGHAGRAGQAGQDPDHLTLPAELERVTVPVVLFFGLLRPYKGIDVLLRAWRGIAGAELWIVGRPRMALAPLRALAGPGVRLVARFVSDAELRSFFRRADLVVLPYSRTERFDQSGVLATALAFGKPTVVTDVGGFGEVAALGAARLVAPDDVAALHDALTALLADAGERERACAGGAGRCRRTVLVGRGGSQDAGALPEPEDAEPRVSWSRSDWSHRARFHLHLCTFCVLGTCSVCLAAWDGEDTIAALFVIGEVPDLGFSERRSRRFAMRPRHVLRADAPGDAVPVTREEFNRTTRLPGPGPCGCAARRRSGSRPASALAR